ncbi:MAG: hypothetical protein Q8880_12345 [Bacteroidota bacterium]|nr:hypothetical protein [Bacteroidota bacterium]
MSYEQPFSDPMLYMKRGKDQPYLEILEEIYVDDKGKALLTEIPYRFDRVQILEQTGGAGDTDIVDGGSFTDSTKNGSETIIFPTMYEVDSGTLADNQYLVDYIQGVITFNISQVGAKFLCKYTGTGYHYISSSRIYYKQNPDGTVTTMKQVLDSSLDTINNIQNAMDNANTAANNATNVTENFQSLLDQQKLVYKQSVATFSAIATTYPTPELGWRVVTKDTGIAYRYDGTTWLEVDMSTTVEGFNVTISDAAPANVNVLWLNVPNVNQTTRVVKSSTAPSDTSVIWWES